MLSEPVVSKRDFHGERSGLSERGVLAVFAHPDDAELTCFGTLANLAAENWRIYVFYVTAGESSRAPGKHCRIDEAKQAAEIIGAQGFSGQLRDGFICYDGQSVGLVEQKIDELRPQIVMTHFPQDSGLGHQDHVEIGKAATNAAVRSRHVQMVIQAEPPLLSLSFVPNLFIDISTQVEKKVRAVECHRSESGKPFMDRTAILDRGRWWARQARVHNLMEGEFFEPFVLVKGIGVVPLLSEQKCQRGKAA
jgi:LmbE family N-acetylglucosaminyl deacetylase